MRIRRLNFVDFRNYAEVELVPDRGMNLLLGPNGAGKTNILEGLHLVATGLSPRAGRDQEMVRWGCAAFSVRAEVEEDVFPGASAVYQVTYTSGRGKAVRRGGKALTGRARTAVVGGAVMFSPDDLHLVKGSPGGRRTFLDLIAVKRWPRARGLLRRYELVLAHRNRLLADIAGGKLPGRAGLDQLSAWTAQLADLGGEVLEQRVAVCAALSPLLARAYRALGGAEVLSAVYESDVLGPEPSCAGRAELKPLLQAALDVRLADERRRGVTLAGPHRDDLRLTLDSAPARVFASQGQQRTIALALRLAETTLLRKALDEEPLLLLDDVFSELDPFRRKALLSEVSRPSGRRQTFLTATDRAGIPDGGLEDAAVFTIEDGTVYGP